MTGPRIDRPEPVTDTPQPGYYKTRLVKGGPLVPCAIWWEDLTQTWQCVVDSQPAEVMRHWPWCARHPLTEAEYLDMVDRRLKADAPSGSAPIDYARPGHNAPPPDDVSAADVLLEEAGDVPETLASREDAERAVLLVKRAVAVEKRLKGSQEAAQAPWLEKATEAARPFREALCGLEKSRKTLLQRVHRYRMAHGGEKISTDWGAKAYGRKTARLEIVDADALPPGFLMPNEKKIADALKAGIDVPGARLVETETTVVS